MKKTLSFTILSIILILTYFVYSNHFKNGFHFDDSHTIVDNLYIRDIKNIPKFFKDGTTFSTLPQNQTYRPLVTTLNALDFYLAGKPTPEPFVFHVNIFISYLVFGVLCYFLFLYFLKIGLENKYNQAIALFTTAWFLWHTANAETINYIIARSDSFSTLLIVLSFVLYVYFPKFQKYYFYFIPVMLGFFVKEVTAMFIPILLIYKLLFEQNLSVKKWFSTKIFVSIKQVAVPLVLSLILFLITRKLTPDNWQTGGVSAIKYLFTQPFVIFHYVYNFILPLNLVVDSDWQPITFYSDDRVLAGILFIISLIIIIYKTSFDQKTKPIAFGILWFLIALAPTSSIIPFGEVLNDHRTFFPYIGLFIASATFIRNLIFKHHLLEKNSSKWALIVSGIIFLSLHAYGTRQRNEVWKTDASLWYECTQKAPQNGRGWMNYGLTLMQKGDFNNAILCYQKTLSIWQNYPFAYINLAVAQGALGDKISAEANFKKGLSLDPNLPDAYYLFGQFLINSQRTNEAKALLEKGLNLSPKNEKLLQLAASISSYDQNTTDKIKALLKTISEKPTPENYLDLSLFYYNLADFRKCIDAANEALKLRPNYDLAYNNICAAHNQLKEYDKAIEVGKRGLQINPNNQLLAANLAEALKLKK